MMDTIATQTVDWLASTGAPNAVVVATLLTHPSVWSDKVQELGARALDRLTADGGES